MSANPNLNDLTPKPNLVQRTVDEKREGFVPSIGSTRKGAARCYLAKDIARSSERRRGANGIDQRAFKRSCGRP